MVIKMMPEQKFTSLDREVLASLAHFIGPINENEVHMDKNRRTILYKGRHFAYGFYGGFHLWEYRNGYVIDLFERERIRNKKIVAQQKRKRFRKYILLTVLTLAALKAVSNFRGRKDSHVIIETETGSQIPIETMVETDGYSSLDVTTEAPVEEIPVEDITSLDVEIPESPFISYKSEKRLVTHQYFGAFIEKYAQRYGLDASFLEALISQEREDDIERPNPGQLTDSICGGNGFKAPVYEDGVCIGWDKIFILDDFYQNYPLKDLDTLGHFSKFTLEQQEEVQKAIALKQQGYEILKITDLKNGTSEKAIENNIRLSAFYLSYLVNRQGDLFLGAASYNAGPSKINKNTEYQVLFTGIDSAGDRLYLPHIATYFNASDYMDGFNILLEDGSQIHYNLKEMKEENTYEKDAYSIRR